MKISADQGLFLLVTNTAGDVRRFWLPLLRQARAAGFRCCCAVPVPAGETARDGCLARSRAVPAGDGSASALSALAEEAGLCGADADLALVRTFPLERKGLNPLRDVRTCHALWRIFRQEQPQVVLAATIKCVIYGGLAWRLVLAARRVRQCWRGMCARGDFGSPQQQAGGAAQKAGDARLNGDSVASCEDDTAGKAGGTARREERFFAAITGLGFAFEADSLPKRLLRALVCHLYRAALGAASGIFFQNEDDVAVFRSAGIVRGGEDCATVADRAKLCRESDTACARPEATACGGACVAAESAAAESAAAGGVESCTGGAESAVIHVCTGARNVAQQPAPPADAAFRIISVSSRPPVCLTAGVGVDVSRFQSAPLPPLPPHAPLIFLLAARLLLAKGIAEYAEAARLLRQRWPVSAARFLLLGSLEQGAGAVRREELDGWLAQGALEYWGAAADVRPALHAAHVLVLPSWREGRPTVIMEGFAMGRPAVVSDAPGCRETVRQGVEGLLTPPHDPVALAAAMESLLRAPERVPLLAAAARRAALCRCDARAVAAGMFAFMTGGKEQS